jgi:serine palmitoyltransferase
MRIRGVKNTPVLNLCSFDFLGMSQNAEVKEVSKKALEVYGCGSCGPRGFYGTIDQHLKVEAAIAEFMGTQVRLIISLRNHNFLQLNFNLTSTLSTLM